MSLICESELSVNQRGYFQNISFTAKTTTAVWTDLNHRLLLRSNPIVILFKLLNESNIQNAPRSDARRWRGSDLVDGLRPGERPELQLLTQ